jgi:hypothetical protein
MSMREVIPIECDDHLCVACGRVIRHETSRGYPFQDRWQYFHGCPTFIAVRMGLCDYCIEAIVNGILDMGGAAL